jgi:hypothetical protein
MNTRKITLISIVCLIAVLFLSIGGVEYPTLFVVLTTIGGGAYCISLYKWAGGPTLANSNSE